MATFTNQATLRYNNSVINSNITTGEILEVLSATKTAVIETYAQGTETTYVINIVNSGTTAYTGLTLTDNLGAYTFGTTTPTTLTPLDYVDGSVRYYINGVLQAQPTAAAGPPLTVTGITVPAGGVATIIYVARANQFAPLGTTDSITNTATIDGGGVTAFSASETVTPEAAANLTINKAVSPTTVAENGRLTYTFTIQNLGNTTADAADNVAITDTFLPILTDLAVSLDGVTWTETTNYTYNEATGEFATVPGQITVPAATYTQNPVTGELIIQPGVTVLTVSGTV